MQDFIVLGLIPGTNLQINFVASTIICLTALGALSTYYLLPRTNQIIVWLGVVWVVVSGSLFIDYLPQA
jgi:hypothetical protein